MAKLLGHNVERSRFYLIVVSTLLAGIAVSVSGLIGFVGLVVPHMLRLLVGNDYKYLLPLSCLGGGILLVFADAIARSWFDPIELPVGILLSFLGGPFFLYLIHREASNVISVNKVFYAHSERFQMQNMNVHIKAGEVVSLIGPNGSGNLLCFV